MVKHEFLQRSAFVEATYFANRVVTHIELFELRELSEDRCMHRFEVVMRNVEETELHAMLEPVEAGEHVVVHAQPNEIPAVGDVLRIANNEHE